MWRRVVVGLLVGGCLLASLSCAPAPPPAPKLRKGVSLFGAGATFPAPLLEVWFAAYEQVAPVYIAYEAVGSGEGVKRFIGKSKDLESDQSVDFGMSDSAMTDAQMAEVARGAQLVPVTAGAVALVYNLPEFKGQLRLSREALSEILLGKITRWDDPKLTANNSDAPLPKLPIMLVARSDSSGTTFVLANHLNAISSEWRDRFGATTLIAWPQKKAVLVKGNGEVALRVAKTPGAFGYVQYDYAKHLGLKMAALENKTGQFIAPSTESAASAIGAAELPSNLRLFFSDPDGTQSYPIVSFSWALLYKDYQDPQRAAAIRELFKWLLTKGQKSSDALGYVPLPEKVVAAAMAAVESVGPR